MEGRNFPRVSIFSFFLLTGNSQGKMQKDGTLGENRAKDDFLLQPFQEGKLLMVNVPLPTNAGDKRKFIF